MKTDTERAIEFLNDCQDDYEELQEEGNNKGILEVIRLLRRGEVDSKELKVVKEELKKVWKMWEELKKKNSSAILNFVENYDDVRTIIEQSKMLRNFLMYKIKQKYFPEEEIK